MKAFNKKRKPKHSCGNCKITKRIGITDYTPTGKNMNFSLKFNDCKDC